MCESIFCHHRPELVYNHDLAQRYPECLLRHILLSGTWFRTYVVRLKNPRGSRSYRKSPPYHVASHISAKEFFGDSLYTYYQVVKKTHQFWDACHFVPANQIFMKICTIYFQSVFGSIYKNHISNLSSFEDIIPNALKVMLFQYHKALWGQIYKD